MKITTKIYHILHDRLKTVKQQGAISSIYLSGYSQALLDSLKAETEIKKGNIDYKTVNGKGYIIKPKEL